MSNKKRTKKYNPRKSEKLLANGLSKDIAMVFVGGDGLGAYPVSIKTGKRIRLSKNAYHALKNVRHEWAMVQTVFCRRQDGQNYHKEHIVGGKHECFEYELEKAFNAAHHELKMTTNEMHRVNVGWIAFVNRDELTEEETKRLYEERRPFDYLSTWEAAERDDYETTTILPAA